MQTTSCSDSMNMCSADIHLFMCRLCVGYMKLRDANRILRTLSGSHDTKSYIPKGVSPHEDLGGDPPKYLEHFP